ncbi:MAG TPA: hypothetical protein VJH21_02730 [Candidatus Paceibacterota bacterium]
MTEYKEKTYILTKKIAKNGNQAIIVIPRFLQEELKPQTIVEIKINVIKEAQKHD